ncbi:MAG: hypothetical protein JWO00_218 [Candidatus Parcubacteria bacterium]|nr:hypothetical protein [Candidatus Parcubacteria bacterium]
MTHKTLISWLPLAIGGTVIMLVGYATLQQNYRQTANDPQIMLAEDAAAALSSGYPVNQMFTAAGTDMSQSQSPFGMVFDEQGTLLGSSAYFGASSTPLLPPAGIFDYVRKNGEDRVTWETSNGLRFAAVALPWKVASSTGVAISIGTSTQGAPQSGFVLAARSLRDTEARVDQLGWISFLGWIGFLLLTYLLTMGAAHAGRKA